MRNLMGSILLGINNNENFFNFKISNGMKRKFRCKENKLRLDKFLKENLKDLSRAKIQDLIIHGFVKVNSKIINKKHYWLDEGDGVEVSPSPPAPLPQGGRGGFSLKKDIKIIKKTKDYVVIEKPAGLIIHGTKDIQEYSLVDYLKKKYPQIKEVGDDSPLHLGKGGGGLEFRPGIMHRLDKNVSGLLVVALDQKMFENLKFQFQNRTVIKKYFALVHGKMENKTGQIDFPIERSRRSGKMVAKPKHLNAKEALTLWDIKKEFDHYTLLDVQIKTGRNHQIRAHMQSINHPVVGDDLYNVKGQKDKLNLDRIFLHAYHLEFKDLNNEVQKFEIKLPQELGEVISLLAS